MSRTDSLSSERRPGRLPRLILIIGVVGAALFGCSKDPAEYVASAKALRAKGDSAAAVIELKNALVAAPQNGEARYLLGATYNQLRDGRAAESELRRAVALGMVEGGHVAVELGRALLLIRGHERLLVEITPSPAFDETATATIHALRGRAHVALGQMPAAQVEFDRASKLQPQSPEPLLGQAVMKLVNNDADGALKTIDDVLARNPSYLDALLLKGDLLRAKTENEKALATYQRAIEIAARQIGPRFAKASILIEMDRLDDAQKEVNQMREVARGHALVSYLQGFIYFRQAKYRQAQEEVLNALKGSPNFPPLLLLSGAVNFSTGSFAQAERHLKQFVQIYPDNLYARKLLMATLTEMNQGKRALEVIQPVLGQDTRDAVLLALVGNAELRMGDYSKAVGYWEKAVATDPKNAAYRQGLALGRLTIGDTERAMKDLEAAAEMNPGDSQSELVMIVTLLKQRQFDRAIEIARSVEKKLPKNPVVHNLLGVAYVGKGDIPNARKNFEQTIAIAPKFLEGVANLAFLDLQENKPQQARERFEKVLAADKNNLQAMLALAGLESRMGQRAKSIDWLRRAVAAHPESLQPRTVLVEQLLAAGDPGAALKEAQAADSAAKSSAEALNLLGRTQMATGHYKEAVATFQKLTGQAPNSATAHHQLGTALASSGAPGAEAEFRKALQLKPDNIDSQMALALVLARSGKTDEALRIGQDLQKGFPKLPIGYVLQGDIYMQQKQYPQALRAYEGAFKVAPLSTTVVKLYMTESNMGNQKAGMARLEQWLSTHPGDSYARSYLADVSLQTGKHKEAAEHYQQLLKQHPNDPLVMNNLAAAYLELKDPRAMQLAQRAYDIAPQNPLVADTFGWALVQNGKNAQGLEVLEKAVSQGGDAPLIRYHFAVALAKAGNKVKARQELEKAIGAKVPFAEKPEAEALLKQL